MSRAIVGNVSAPGFVADLRQDGTWNVPGQSWMEPVLKILYSDPYAGPQDGPFGVLALNRLADDVGGVATIVDLSNGHHADRVY